MTYDEAIARLATAGLRMERRAFGIEGRTGELRLQIGRASAGGFEMSVITSSGRAQWHICPQLDALIELLFAAHQQSQQAAVPDLSAALIALDPARSDE